MSVMNLQEAHELIDKLNFKHPDIMHEALDDVNVPGILGFTVTKSMCILCGSVQMDLHPIPMKFPCECYICGNMSCYVL